jgi:PAS domain S-box-containing protein
MKPENASSLKKGLFLLVVMGLYILAGKWGLSFANVHKSISAIWPATGIALAALLIFGQHFWPVIFVGAFVVNITTAGSIPLCLGIALGNTLEAWLGAYLISTYANGIDVFDRPLNIFKYVGLAGLFSTAISATIGVTSLILSGSAAVDQFQTAWITWWLGDAMGNFLVAPVLILWSRAPAMEIKGKKIVELCLLISAIAITSLAVFSDVVTTHNNSLEFLCIPILLWAAFRFGRRVSTTAVFILATIAIWGTTNNLGPFARSTRNESYILLQAYLATVSLMAVCVATVVWELKRVRDGLEQGREESEIKIREGETSLTQMVQALQNEVHERRRAAEALRISEERFRLVIEGVRDYAIFMMDSTGAIMSWNAGAEKIKGYKAEEILGKHFSCFFPPPDIANGIPALLLKMAQEHARVESQGLRVRKDGTTFLTDGVITALWDKTGRLRGFSYVSCDITQKKQAEQALLQKERLLAHINGEREQLELFAHMASHDLQEPLRKIIIFGDLLKQEIFTRLSEEGKDYLDRMQNAAHRMSRLIDDVLKFSKTISREVPFESVNLNDVMKEVLEDLELRINETNASITSDTLPTIEANRGHMYELLQNILSNAIKYHKKNEPPRVSVTCKELENDFIEIIVEDNGIGFEEKYATRIFKPFERLHRRDEFGGSGIGLAICKRISIYHGGHIVAKSILNIGSTFIITLPRHSQIQTNNAGVS